MTRKRCLLLALFLALLAVGVAGYFVFTDHDPLRSRLDRVELGMSEADARALLADIQDENAMFVMGREVAFGEVWSTRFGEPPYQKLDAHTTVFILARGMMDPQLFVKRTRRGAAYIEFHDGKVVGKMWIEHARPSLFARAKAKLGW